MTLLRDPILRRLVIPGVLDVVIPGRPPTPNARPGNREQERRERREWRDTAILAAKAAMGQYGRWTPAERVRLEVVIVVPDLRKRDFDNGVASLKPLTDGIVTAGVMVDDSTEVIEGFTVEYVYERGASEVRYRVRRIR